MVSVRYRSQNGSQKEHQIIRRSARDRERVKKPMGSTVTESDQVKRALSLPDWIWIVLTACDLKTII